MAKEKDILLDHEYDGIQELDNDLPPWWLWLFYITIAFAVVYLVYYTFTDLGPSQAEEYMMEVNPDWKPAGEIAEETDGLIYHSPYYSPKGEVTPRVMEQFNEYIGPEIDFAALAMEALKRYDDKGMAKLKAMFDVNIGSKVTADNLIMEAMRRAGGQKLAKLQQAFPELWDDFSAAGGSVAQQPVIAAAPTATPAVNEPKIEALTSEADITAGKGIYDKNCLSCHMQGGSGGIGPNFTDDYWIHGAGMNNMVRTINEGVPAKGMITWRGVLKEKEIQQVASYILTLHGTSPANPKAPQGELVEYPLN